MTSPISRNKKVEDLVVSEWDQRYSRKEATLIGVALAGEQNFVIGQILKTSGNNYTPAVSGDTTGVHAVLLENVTVTDDGTVKVPIAFRGPLILNEDELVTPATTNRAAQITAIAALGIAMVKQPTNTETLSI